MADFRQKIKAIAAVDGTAAPEPAKLFGMICLFVFLVAVSILTLIMTIGLFRSGSFFFGTASAFFFLLSAATAAAGFPLKRNPW